MSIREFFESKTLEELLEIYNWQEACKNELFNIPSISFDEGTVGFVGKDTLIDCILRSDLVYNLGTCFNFG